MALRAKKPTVKEDPRVKCMISGRSGVGKTYFALDFPSPYFIDTEGGAERKQYIEKLKKAGGIYLGKSDGSQDFQIILDEIQTLATTKHNYKTLVIDSFSHLYLTAASYAEEKLGNEFGRDKKEANRPTRQLMRWIDNIDMNVILICHQKDKWSRKNGDKIEFDGTTFDGYDKLEYMLDLWIEIQKAGKGRVFTIKKSRIDQLAEGDVMPLDFKHFSNLYGDQVVNKDSIPLVMANDVQVGKLEKLIELLNIDQKQVEKWLDKCNAENLIDLTSEQIQLIIDTLESKLKGV